MNNLEGLVWNRIKSKQLLGYKFRRQHGIGPFIVDFYCPKKKLVVEIDGDTHYTPEALVYDETRSSFLREQGIQIMRFTNLDVWENLDGVIEAIMEALAGDTGSPGAGNSGAGNPPLSPLGKGGD
jgi:very-short-patch-repair endonuclease